MVNVGLAVRGAMARHTATAVYSLNHFSAYEHDVKPEEPIDNKMLGHLRLRDAETNEMILVPTPSDPNVPLNRYYIGTIQPAQQIFIRSTMALYILCLGH
jgi:hypothetical protein